MEPRAESASSQCQQREPIHPTGSIDPVHTGVIEAEVMGAVLNPLAVLNRPEYATTVNLNATMRMTDSDFSTQ